MRVQVPFKVIFPNEARYPPLRRRFDFPAVLPHGRGHPGQAEPRVDLLFGPRDDQLICLGISRVFLGGFGGSSPGSAESFSGVRGSSPRGQQSLGMTGQQLAAVVGHHLAEGAGDVERATALAAVELEVCAVQVSYDPFGI